MSGLLKPENRKIFRLFLALGYLVERDGKVIQRFTKISEEEAL